MASTYTPEPDAVIMSGLGGPVRLTLEQADQMLSIFLHAGAVRDFNALHEAVIGAGGIPWVSKPLSEAA